MGVQGAGAPETVSAVVTPALSAAGYRVQVTTLAREPAVAIKVLAQPGNLPTQGGVGGQSRGDQPAHLAHRTLAAVPEVSRHLPLAPDRVHAA